MSLRREDVIRVFQPPPLAQIAKVAAAPLGQESAAKSFSLCAALVVNDMRYRGEHEER